MVTKMKIKNRLIEVETEILNILREISQDELDAMDGFYTTKEIADSVLMRAKQLYINT